MGLTVVSEYDDDFGLSREALDLVGQPAATQRTPQGARGAGLHTSFQNDRAQTSPRPAAALFPTDQVIAVLAAIGAVLGARLALYVAIACMFALGFINPDDDSMLRMAIFGGFVMLPLVWLSARRNI